MSLIGNYESDDSTDSENGGKNMLVSYGANDSDDSESDDVEKNDSAGMINSSVKVESEEEILERERILLEERKALERVTIILSKKQKIDALLPAIENSSHDENINIIQQRLEDSKNNKDNFFSNFNSNLKAMTSFGDPYLLERWTKEFSIKQYGSNFNPDFFSPSNYSTYDDYYDALASKQRRYTEKVRIMRSNTTTISPSTAGPTSAFNHAGQFTHDLEVQANKANKYALEAVQLLIDKKTSTNTISTKKRSRPSKWDRDANNKPSKQINTDFKS